MLRVAEQVFRTDVGRQRNANEDSYFSRTPVFAVADGMGGAQAGEVASRIAVEAFEPDRPPEAAPEGYLADIAHEANDRIHAVASADASRSGMGTTLTAAMVDGEELALAHVGDSRAYLYRDGVLKQLTNDHSLVEELRRQGQLTREEAEEHPQRSVITRALGVEPAVDVDTMTVRLRSGDVILLCTDGLTTMVSDERLTEVLGGTESLESAGAILVDEANEAGGRDNITVGIFRLEEVGAPVEEGATLVGTTAAEAGLTREAVAAEREPQAPRRREPVAPAPSGPSRARRLLKVIVAAAIAAVIVVGAAIGVRQIHFLGIDEGGRIALYRGLPYDLPLGIELYDERYSSPFSAASVPADRADSLSDHKLRSRDDAIDLVADLESEVRELEAASRPDAQPRGGPGGKRPGRSGGGSGGSPGQGSR